MRDVSQTNIAPLSMSYYRAKIAEIYDEDFQTLVDEVYHCVGWRRDDNSFPTLFYLMQGIGAQDPKAFTLNHLPTTGILASKIGKLPDGIVYDLCLEIAGLKGTHIDDGKTVLSLLKLVLPKTVRVRKPSRGQVRHDAQTALIRQRRANGDL